MGRVPSPAVWSEAENGGTFYQKANFTLYMPEQKNFEHAEERKGGANSPQEIRLMKMQWIPDTEEIIPNVPDGAERKSFEEELSRIKADFTELENADFGDEEVMKRVKEVYKRSENLFGEVSIRLTPPPTVA